MQVKMVGRICIAGCALAIAGVVVGHYVFGHRPVREGYGPRTQSQRPMEARAPAPAPVAQPANVEVAEAGPEPSDARPLQDPVTQKGRPTAAKPQTRTAPVTPAKEPIHDPVARAALSFVGADP